MKLTMTLFQHGPALPPLHILPKMDNFVLTCNCQNLALGLPAGIRLAVLGHLCRRRKLVKMKILIPMQDCQNIDAGEPMGNSLSVMSQWLRWRENLPALVGEWSSSQLLKCQVFGQNNLPLGTPYSMRKQKNIKGDMTYTKLQHLSLVLLKAMGISSLPGLVQLSQVPRICLQEVRVTLLLA
ncbi:unnamed protein product [Choristocarpus tenellus]